MLISVVCKAKKCPNKGVEYLIPSQDDPVMCGGCGDFIIPAETSATGPELLPYVPNLEI